MINCDVIRDLMPLYADNLISSSGRSLVDQHIQSCPECRELLTAMCTPIESESEASEATDYIHAIHQQKKHQTRRMIGLCLLTVLVCVIGWWIYMETHFYGETPWLVTTDEAVILAQMPELELTDGELQLAEELMHHPVIRSALSAATVAELPLDRLAELYGPVTPPGSTCTSVAVLSEHCVCLDFRGEELRLILEYTDVDNTGTVDLIRKTVAVLKEDGTADTVYTLEYVPGVDRSWYEMHKSRHIWFSFLSMP